MSIPNYKSGVEAAILKYPDAFAHAHMDGDPRKHEFIKLLARDLHAIDSNVALNGKRGNPHELSMDALNILCEAAESDGRTPDNRPCVVVDVIGAAGAKPPYTPQHPAPHAAWTVYKTRTEGSGANVPPDGEEPASPPVPQRYPYPDERTAVSRFQDRVKAAYKSVGRAFPDALDQDAYRHFARYGYSCSQMPEPEAADKHIRELREDLRAPAE